MAPDNDARSSSPLESVVQTIVREVDPERVYLFGSRARGEAGPDSDIDLLVAADMPGDRRERSIAVRKLFPNRTIALDVFVFHQEEFNRQKKLINSISDFASTEGEVLYERA